MSTDVRVSVVIPTIKNGKLMVLKLIEDAIKQFKDAEIVIVRKERPVARARNLGATKASGDILLFIDDDLVFDPKLLLDVINKVLRNEKAIVGMGVENFFFKFKFISTGFMALWKNDFVKIGGFDERLYGYEDLDFSVRALRKKYRIISCSLSIKHHNPRRLLAFLSRSLQYECCGTLVAIKHAQYFRLNNFRWFFPLFVNTNETPSLYKGMHYIIFRNPATRILTRTISFHYWILQKLTPKW